MGRGGCVSFTILSIATAEIQMIPSKLDFCYRTLPHCFLTLAFATVIISGNEIIMIAITLGDIKGWDLCMLDIHTNNNLKKGRKTGESMAVKSIIGKKKIKQWQQVYQTLVPQIL